MQLKLSHDMCDIKLDAVLKHLPSSVRDLIDLIGLHDTEQVIKHLGGTTFPFGRGKLETERLQDLRRTLGNDLADTLVEHFNGEDVYIPHCQKAMHELKKAQFFADLTLMQDRGYSLTRSLEKLCPVYRISDRTAWKWLKEKANETNKQTQQALF